MASSTSTAGRRTSQLEDGLSGLPNTAYGANRGPRRSQLSTSNPHSNFTISGLPRTEAGLNHISDSDGTNGEETDDTEEVLEDLLNPVSKQLDFASQLGQELVAQRATLERLQSKWQNSKNRGEVDTAKEIEREIKSRREEYASTTISRLKQIAESGEYPIPRSNNIPQTPTRSRRKTEDDPFIDSRVSARRSRLNQTPTTSRFMSFPTHSTNDIENRDVPGDEEMTGTGGEMGFLVAEHMTTELRRLMALLAEKDLALKEMQEKTKSTTSEEDALRKRLEIFNAQQERTQERIWELEMAEQNSRTEISTAQTALKKSENELKKTAKERDAARSEAETFKSEVDRLNVATQTQKQHYETEIAKFKGKAGALERDRSDLAQQLQRVKQRKSVGSGLLGSGGRSPLRSPTPGLLTPDDARKRSRGDLGDDDDVFGAGDENKRRGPGLDANGDPFNPDDIYGSDFGDSPNHSAYGADIRDRSPLAPLPDVNTLEDTQARILELEDELARLKEEGGRRERRGSPAVDSSFDSPVAHIRRGGAIRGNSRLGSRGVRGIRAGRGGARRGSALARNSASSDGTPSNYSASPIRPSPLGSGGYPSAYSPDGANTPARPSSRLAQPLGDYADLDSPESVHSAAQLVFDRSLDDDILRDASSFEGAAGTLGDELADFEDVTEHSEHVESTYVDVGTMTDPVMSSPVAEATAEPVIQSVEVEAQSFVRDFVTPTHSSFALDAQNLAANSGFNTPRAMPRSSTIREAFRRSDSDLTIGPVDTETEGGETDYDDARSVATMTAGSTGEEETDWHTGAESAAEWHTGAESSADDDSDGDSIRAPHYSRFNNQTTPRTASRHIAASPVQVREVVREIIKEVEVVKIQEVPTPFEVIREVEVIQHVAVPYEVIREVEVIRNVPTPYEVIKEVEVIREVPIPYEVIKEIIREVPTPYEVIKEIPAPYEVIREVEIVREVAIPVPYEVLREIEVLKEVPQPYEVIKEVEVIREIPTPFEVIKEVQVEVIREVQVEVLRDVFVPVPVEIVKLVDRDVERIVEVIIEKEIIREVPVVVEKQVEVVKEVPFETIVERIVDREVIREVPVDREVIKEIIKEVPVQVFVDRPVDREVEKIVIKEVPVDVVRHIPVPFETIKEVVVEVEKIVNVPVEVFVDREVIREVFVDKPVEVIKEVEVPVTKEVIVDRPVEVIKEVHVDRPVEVIKEVIVDRPVEVIKEVMVDRPVEVIKEVMVDRPVEVIKEVMVDRPVEVIKEVIVDRLVEVIKEVMVDRPVEVVKEVMVDRPVEVIKEVFVDRPVEVIKEVFVDRPVEVIKEITIDRPVEVIREVMVDRPVEVIREVEVIKEVQVPFEVIKEVQVPFEVIKEVEVPVEVIKEVMVPVEIVKEVFVDKPFEVIREIEVIKHVDVPYEVIKEVVIPHEVVREVEVVKEVEVIKEVEVTKEVIREVPVEKEVIREVFVDREVIKEVPVDREVIREVFVDREVVKEVPVDREVIREVTVVTKRAQHQDATTQTDPVPAMPTSLSAPTPDIGLFRVTSGSNMDFLKNPPMTSASSSTFGKPTVRVKQRSNSPTRAVRGVSREEDSESDVAPRSPVASIRSYVSIDRSRPPIMSLPPPPTAPPPALSVERTSSVPLAPPLADLGQARAKTPMSADFNKPRAFLVPENGSRTNANSMPPPTASRQTSTASLRSAKNNIPVDDGRYSTRKSIEQSRDQVKRLADVVVGGRPGGGLKAQSRTASYASSRSSDYGHARVPSGLARELGMPTSSDPALIQAITQVMIGEFMWKNTRRTLGKGMSENRHKRFFWVHPYVKTLYWSPVDPGGENTAEARSKSIYITGIKVMKDGGAADPNTWHESIIICSPTREVQMTAMSKDRHDAWVNALLFLCERPAPSSRKDRASIVPIEALTTPVRHSNRPELPDDFGRRKTPHSIRSINTYATESVTPRATGGPRSQSTMSMRSTARGKRPGTPAHEYLSRIDAGLPVDGLMSVNGRPRQLTHDENTLRYGEGNDTIGDFENMENVRQSHDGGDRRSLARRGNASSSSRRPSAASQLAAPSFHSRQHPPRSPSAWSYRSGNRSDFSDNLDSGGDVTLTPGGVGLGLPPIPPVPTEVTYDMRDTEDAGATPSVKSRKRSLIKRPSLNFKAFGSRSMRSKSRPNSP